MAIADHDFTQRLIEFGLSGKEAQLYLHLLKYGPKTPTPLAKSLKTYRVDVHRTLTSLVEKGMVRPSLDAPTVYAAVDLDQALNSAIKKHESELREMEARKRELQELSQQQRFAPAEEISTFKIIKSVKEAIATTLQLIASAKTDIAFIAPYALPLFRFGVHDEERAAMKRGVRVRAIADLSHPLAYLNPSRRSAIKDIGMRSYDGYSGIYFIVVDQTKCLSSIEIGVEGGTPDEHIVGLYCDSPTYAAYLTSIFEIVWQHSEDGTARIKTLVEGSE